MIFLKLPIILLTRKKIHDIIIDKCQDRKPVSLQESHREQPFGERRGTTLTEYIPRAVL